ncbi:hypothetical protein SAMN04489867_2554 [Pedococcus dokdonensis]|uniref:Uncharacterized protein n=1 Tax=Pedococcus dokdonensis TaxID=443156 RepID=A0A1H0SYD5_9MICO|nr:hypothetical protein [Pedococcus dokdonensis]SDP46659.1 hypothetical protein SAMN04489867_2554 [Pedococcus dokdonensis]
MTAISSLVRAAGLLVTMLAAGLLWTVGPALVLALMGYVDAVVSRPWIYLWAAATLVAGALTLDHIEARNAG